MATVTNTIKLPDGSTPTSARVEIELVASEMVGATEAGWITASDITVLSVARPTVTNGAWTADLTPNANIDPSGTVYRVYEYVGRDRYTHYISVGSGGGSVHDLLTSGPSGVMFDSVTNHAADTTTHGATGAVVGTTNTQTLTNKTLTNPVMSFSSAAALAARTALRSQRSNVVDVRDYGTVGDGTTEDDAAILAAWADVPEGGTLYIPETASGYATGETLVFTGKTYATIKSDGKAWIRANDKTKSIIDVGDSSGCRIDLEGLRLSYTPSISASDTAAIGIRAQNVAHAKWERIEIAYTYTAIRTGTNFLGAAGDYFFSNTLDAIHIYDFHGYGIYIGYTGGGNTHSWGDNIYVSAGSASRAVLGAIKLDGSEFSFGAVNVEGMNCPAGALISAEGQVLATFSSVHFEEAQGLFYFLASRAAVSVGVAKFHRSELDPAVAATQTMFAAYLDGSFDVRIASLTEMTKDPGASLRLYAASFPSGGGYYPSLNIGRVLDAAGSIDGASDFSEVSQYSIGSATGTTQFPALPVVSSTGALPAASAHRRGQRYLVQGTGVADRLFICRRQSDGSTYAWDELT